MLKEIGKILHCINELLNKQQKILGCIVFGFVFVGAFLEMIGVSAIMPLVSAIMSPTVLLENDLIFRISKVFGINDYHQMLTFICGMTLVIYIVKNLYFIFLSWLRAKYSCKIQRELSVNTMKFYMQRGYEFFLRENTGELMQGMGSDVANVYLIINNGLRLLTEGMTIILICFFMFVADFTLAFTMTFLVLLCLALVSYLFRKSMSLNGVKHRKYASKCNQAVLNALQGIKEILVLKKQKYFTDAYEKNYVNQQIAQVHEVIGSESPAYIIEMVCITGILLVVFGQIGDAQMGAKYVPVLAAFAVGAFRILPSLGKMSSAINGITYAIPSLYKAYENYTEAIKISAKEEQLGKEVELEPLDSRNTEKDKVILKNIGFRYENTEEMVIKELNLVIKAGKSVAFIGRSGAGKTTLADIILGLLKPQEGLVYINGQNIGNAEAGVRSLVGFVPQSIYLVDDTIRRNIAFGIEDGNIDMQCVKEAIEQSQLSEFIASLPLKEDTIIGERGTRLSGGQRQRIAIARALYNRPEVLVLDEATSALDNTTEEAVMNAIELLKGKLTLIIVAHRLSTVKGCDAIYEIRNGKAVEIEKKTLF